MWRQITQLDFNIRNDAFKVETTGSKAYDCKVVLGAQGKRSIIDKKLNRKFISKRHPYVGVKYHARGEFPDDLVSLHNFSGGYCGVNAVEDGLINVCYLSHRSNFRDHGSIEAEGCSFAPAELDPNSVTVIQRGNQATLILENLSFSQTFYFYLYPLNTRLR